MKGSHLFLRRLLHAKLSWPTWAITSPDACDIQLCLKFPPQQSTCGAEIYLEKQHQKTKQEGTFLCGRRESLLRPDSRALFSLVVSSEELVEPTWPCRSWQSPRWAKLGFIWWLGIVSSSTFRTQLNAPHHQSSHHREKTKICQNQRMGNASHNSRLQL